MLGRLTLGCAMHLVICVFLFVISELLIYGHAGSDNIFLQYAVIAHQMNSHYFMKTVTALAASSGKRNVTVWRVASVRPVLF